MKDKARVKDLLKAVAGYARRPGDGLPIFGWGTYELRGPDGQLKLAGEFANLITNRGDELYAKLGHGTAQDLPSGMRLGTNTDAPAKAGAASAIGSYVNGSSVEFDSKTVAAIGSNVGWRITHVASWAAGVATANGIAEAVITNQNPLTNVGGGVTNTISRALLNPVVNKGADDTLTLTWNHDFLGA